jgi:hypothetical protein
MAATDLDVDWQLRLAAFAALRSLREREGGVVTKEGLDEGFTFRGERIAFRNPQKGIWRPHQLSTASGAALTLVTVRPSPADHHHTTTRSRLIKIISFIGTKARIPLIGPTKRFAEPISCSAR